MEKKWTCKDCVLYDTDACRYGYWTCAFDYNVQYCDDILIDPDEAYKQGCRDTMDKLMVKLKRSREKLA